jgi:ankyrin repeat protein
MSRDMNGKTPLHVALETENPSPEVVQILLQAGSDPYATDNEGLTAMHYCFFDDNLDAFLMFTQFKPLTKADLVKDLFFSSISFGARRCYSYLLDQKMANPHLESKEGFTTTHLAVISKSKPCVLDFLR